MSDQSRPQVLYTADPTSAPADGEYFGDIKADLDGIVWIRPIATITLGPQTSRDANSDGIDPATANIVAFDVAAFNYIWDATNLRWDRERRYQAADNMPTPEARQVLSYLFGFDGADWDMLRTGAGDANGVAAETLGLLKILARLTAQNAAGTYDRLLTLVDNADAEGPDVTGLLGVVSRLQGWNGSDYDRLKAFASDSDAIGTNTLGLLGALAHSMIFNGTNWQRDYKTANFNANTNSNVGTSSTSILAGSITRKYLLIQNHDDTDSIYINFGAAATTSGLEIIPGGNYEPLVVPTDEIFAIADAAATTYTIASA